tara:strand:- start:1069 stop:1173 length:105 start_codon:yes stop_codon:yes gene_type:complete
MEGATLRDESQPVTEAVDHADFFASLTLSATRQE